MRYGVVVLVLLAAACAGGEDQESAVSEAVVAYSEAFLGGEGGAAYGMLSDGCRGQLDEGEFMAVVAVAAGQYGPAELSMDAVEVDGGTASVSYSYPDMPQLDQTGERWVFEGDRWRNDDC